VSADPLANAIEVGIRYEITKTVTSEGYPTWALHRVCFSPLASMSKLLAVNEQRAVLENAIKYLTTRDVD
jgi:hypothetical protein